MFWSVVYTLRFVCINVCLVNPNPSIRLFSACSHCVSWSGLLKSQGNKVSASGHHAEQKILKGFNPYKLCLWWDKQHVLWKFLYFRITIVIIFLKFLCCCGHLFWDSIKSTCWFMPRAPETNYHLFTQATLFNCSKNPMEVQASKYTILLLLLACPSSSCSPSAAPPSKGSLKDLLLVIKFVMRHLRLMLGTYGPWKHLHTLSTYVFLFKILK